MKKLLIFDMDGVILDSEPLHARAEHGIMADYGIPEQDLSWTVGVSSYIVWGRFIREYGIPSTPGDLLSEQYRRIREIVKTEKIPPSAGLVDLIQLARGKGMKIGIASSSNRELVHPIIELLGIKELFDVVVCGDDAAHKKPEPDIYLEVLRQAGVPAEEAITIEDSDCGVAAAAAAHVDCIGYVNPTSGAQKLSGTVGRIFQLSEAERFL